MRTSARASVKIRYGTASDLSNAQESVVQETDTDHDFTTIIPLSNLSPSTIYYVDITVNEKSQLQLPYPQFKTFPVPGTAVSFKFVILTDLHGPYTTTRATLGKASLENPDFVIIGGDLGGGNVDSLEDKRNIFKRVYDPTDQTTYVRLLVSKILRAFPVAHIWDDHDFGGNNADKTYPFKQLSYQVLNEYFPTYELSPYGDWQKFTYGQAEFFMLDARSQRDPYEYPDGNSKSMLDGDHLGVNGQMYWLKQGLLNSKADWKFIVSPVPFNPTLRKFSKTDSWYGFQFERQKIIRFIRNNHITGVVILSGDAHIGALDDGTYAGFPEMLSPSPSLPACSSARDPGKWSHGVYWTSPEGPPCIGYGVVSVQAKPMQSTLQIKNQTGKVKLNLTIQP